MDNSMYGVWLPGKGFLKVKDYYAEIDIRKAREVAKILGGKVLFIDTSIIDLEDLYLEAERKTPWHTFKNFWRHKGNTIDNRK